MVGLLAALRLRLGGLDGRSLLASVARSGVATGAASAAMAGVYLGLDAALPDLAGNAAGRMLTLLLPAAAGGAAYVAVAAVLRAPELATLRRIRGSRLGSA